MKQQAHNENLTLDQFHESYNVRLDAFEGPLDLLLHLIRKNELDIYDIPIADITRQYLDYIKLMKDLNLEVAGDFLLMASTLLHIKSRMLLPQEEHDTDEAEEQDPRAELIKRLLEYQQYKDAGIVLGARTLLGRDVFTRAGYDTEFVTNQTDEGPLELELFDLVEAFRTLLLRIPAESFHDVMPAELFSIADSINEILSLLQERQTVQFEELAGEDLTRERIIVTFLAILELCRLKLIRIFQNEPGGKIWFVPAVAPSTIDET